MPQYKNPVHVTVGDTTLTFSKTVFVDLPDARAFLDGVAARGVSVSVAAHYAKIVARLKRSGRLADPDRLAHNVERTAARAYHRWKAEAYADRLAPVIRAFKRDDLRRAIKWLRRGSLVPPYEGKTIFTQRTPMDAQVALAQGGLDRVTGAIHFTTPPRTVPCTTWTLHVPEKPVPAHTDPCEDCVAVEVSDQQLQIIAAAFEQAWGHRDLNAVPAESLLFGEPPAEDVVVGDGKFETCAALIGPGPVSEALSGVRAKVARDPDSFLARLSEGANGVYLSRDACGDRLQEVLAAIWSAWHSNGVAS